MIYFLIKEIRKRKKIKLKELAKLAGVSISYLSEIENNKVENPNFLIILKISEALEVTLNEIYFADNEIESLRKGLNIYIEIYGLQNSKTLELSKKINTQLEK